MQRTKFRGFKLFHANAEAAESMIRQIDEFPSFFTPREERPLIIDCGANIGISVLEWKTRWPQSEVICFEPDPFAFAILKKNIEANDLPGVRPINVALSDQEGTVTLHGDVSASGDARGNSIDPAWGKRPGSVAVKVPSRRLSSYLDGRPVSFLKLDIEGAEERVLNEIAPQLDQVDAAYVEIHETALSESVNSADRIAALLDRAGFQLESEGRYERDALPSHLAGWQSAVGARQTHLLCWR